MTTRPPRGMGLATSGLGTVMARRGSTWKLAQFVGLVSASAVGAVSVALVVGFMYSSATPADSYDSFGTGVEAIFVAFFTLLVVAVAAVVGIAVAMVRLGIRPVAPILGATLFVLPVLAFSLGDVSGWLAVASLPLAASCGYVLVHPPGRSLVWRPAVCGLVVATLAFGGPVTRPISAEEVHRIRERDYAELGFPLFAAPPPQGFLLDSIEVADPDGFSAPPTTLRMSYRDLPVSGRALSRQSGDMILIDHATRTRLIQLMERRLDSEYDPPARCGYRVSIFGTVVAHSAPCTEVARHPGGAPIFTWSEGGDRMHGTTLSGVLVIGTQPNPEKVPDDIVVELLRSLQPTTPAELARSEP